MPDAGSADRGQLRSGPGPIRGCRRRAFRGLYVGLDGGLWVQLHQPGEEIPEDQLERVASGQPNPRPPDRWREPVALGGAAQS